ncbi:hypothetical protein J6590_105724 [Homalodisca vitripennis]|nr:hypothetical protein J6590_105724 [Homalodisca vitripennis]
MGPVRERNADTPLGSPNRTNLSRSRHDQNIKLPEVFVYYPCIETVSENCRHSIGLSNQN